MGQERKVVDSLGRIILDDDGVNDSFSLVAVAGPLGPKKAGSDEAVLKAVPSWPACL
jgi:hypothetical protein